MPDRSSDIEPPAVLTVAEVRRVLRISRTKAYAQANAFLASDGTKGLPCVRIGDSLRFPRLAIERLIEQPITLAQLDPAHDPADTDPPSTTSISPRTATHRTDNTASTTRLFSA
jgi:hypothetical protein